MGDTLNAIIYCIENVCLGEGRVREIGDLKQARGQEGKLSNTQTTVRQTLLALSTGKKRWALVSSPTSKSPTRTVIVRLAPSKKILFIIMRTIRQIP